MIKQQLRQLLAAPFGASHEARTLEDLVNRMTDREAEALCRILRATRNDGEDDGRRAQKRRQMTGRP